jgi:hypothetical protein
MDKKSLSVEELAQLLRETAQAHHVYEQSLGHPDKEWPQWYAEYMIRKLEDRESKAEKPNSSR